MLMPCPECKHSISEAADDCPKCGYKLTEAARIAFRIKTAEQARRGRAGLGCTGAVLLVLSVLASIPGFYPSATSYHKATDAERLQIVAYVLDGQPLTDREKDLLERGHTGGEIHPPNPVQSISCSFVVFGLPALAIFIYLGQSKPAEPTKSVGSNGDPQAILLGSAFDAIQTTPMSLLASFLFTSLVCMWVVFGILFSLGKLGAWFFAGTTVLFLPTAILIYLALKKGAIS